MFSTHLWRFYEPKQTALALCWFLNAMSMKRNIRSPSMICLSFRWGQADNVLKATWSWMLKFVESRTKEAELVSAKLRGMASRNWRFHLIYQCIAVSTSQLQSQQQRTIDPLKCPVCQTTEQNTKSKIHLDTLVKHWTSEHTGHSLAKRHMKTGVIPNLASGKLWSLSS